MIATADKVAPDRRLARTGLRRLEVTSFVRADVIPQLADAAEVLRAIDVPAEVAVSVLIPNERGLDNALALREAAGSARRSTRSTSSCRASESHNRANVNRSVEESLSGLEAVLARAREAGLRCEGVISVSFGCPYEGHVEPERVFGIAERLIDAGAEEIGFGDTTGMANPRQVRAFFAAPSSGSAPRRSSPRTSTTRAGRAWRTCSRRWSPACESFESSFGELGGCPVPAGATGNIATEDLVSMLDEMGIETARPRRADARRARVRRRSSDARWAATR